MKDIDSEKKYLYTDTTDKELLLRRKRDLKIDFIVLSILYIFIILFWTFAIFLNFESVWFNTMIISFLVIFIVGMILIIRSFKIYKKSGQEGISLTHEHLDLYGKKIKLDDILYCEVVDFAGIGGIKSVVNRCEDRVLALFIKLENNKIKERFIRCNETTDVLKLSNRIRQIIGLVEQEKIEVHSPYVGYHRWKKDIVNKLKKR